MSRFWQVLKFAPAALLALLALLWLASMFTSVGVSTRSWALLATQGRATWQVVEGNPTPAHPKWRTRWVQNSFGSFGHRKYMIHAGNLAPIINHDYDVPISFLMLLLLPIAIGCVTRFQFHLWMYFVGVALVAICVLSWRFD